MIDRRAELLKEKLAEKLAEHLGNSKEFIAALKIVRENSEGKIWLIGGMVYRPLANFLYDTPIPSIDLDFVINKGHTHYLEPYGDPYACNDIHLPEEWELRSHYGESRFVNTQEGLSLKIDIVQLQNFHSTQSRDLPPTLDNFLNGTPLTIQSIAYDIEKGQIIGDIGLVALYEQKISVNYLNEARYFAHKKGTDLHSMIREKAASLGFEAIYPPVLDSPEGNLSFPPGERGCVSVLVETSGLSTLDE